MAAKVLRIGTRRDDDRYEGVLRDGTKVVAACGHAHHNRDESSQTNGRSARACIYTLIACCRNPDMAAAEASVIRNSMNTYIRLNHATASMAERFRTAAEAGAATFTARLPGIAALIGDRPVFGYTTQVVSAPPTPDPVPCHHCNVMIQPTRFSAERGWFDWRDARNDYWCRGDGTHFSHEPAAPAATTLTGKLA